ncbi:helix-turn-helix domain-containing protein [Bacteroides sp. Phil13]|uniref:helix-turn-helix transcriptional regulator n=1 Tax=Bacteroides sp. Phil13 TaxID=1929999 RepID=UPI0025806958|nr:helix-turn-helix domain-containing protein [Bacteroides sp. Phil13]
MKSDSKQDKDPICGSLQLKSDLSEQVNYNIPEFPAYVKNGFLSYYPGYSAITHWHDDVEFIVILSGYMLYNINGNVVRLEEGEGIFVNSRQIHYGYSTEQKECQFICILLHPSLLCSSSFIEMQYVTPILFDSSLEYILLNQCIPWQNTILSLLKTMYRYQVHKDTLLKIQSLFFDIWTALFNNIPVKKKLPTTQDQQLSSLKEMTGFIQKHYQEKITLEDIAYSGSVCKTSCCSIFKKYMKQTPFSYLIDYRLKKSIDLLRTTNMTITEISLEVGFMGLSYYTETFKKHFNCSPSEYSNR